MAIAPEADVSAVDFERDHFRVVETFLKELSGRLRLVRIIHHVSICLIASSLLLVALRLACYIPKLSFLLSSFDWAVLALIYVLPAAAAVGVALNARWDLLLLARYADDRLGLKDRLATALSLRLSMIETRFSDQIYLDAARSVSSVDAKKTIPIAWSKLQTWALLAIAAASLLVFLPSSPLSTLSKSYRAVLSSAVSLHSGKTSPQTTQAAPPAHEVMLNHQQPEKPTSVTAPGRPIARSESAAAAQQKKMAALNKAAEDVDKLMGKTASSPASGAKGNAKPASSNASPTSHQTAPSSPAKNSSDHGATSGSSTPTLGEKLRQLADKMSTRRMTTGEEKEAAGSLDDVNHKLDGLQMPQTQGKISDAENDLNGDRQNQAISDVRSAAYLADHEGATPPPGQSGGQSGGGKNQIAVPEKNGSAGNSSGGNNGNDSGGRQSHEGSGSQGGGSSQSSNGNKGSNSGGGQQSHDNSGSQEGGGSGTGTGGGGSKSTPNAPGGAPNHHQSGPNTGGGTQSANFGAPRKIDPTKIGSAMPLPPIVLPVSSPTGRSFDTQGTHNTPGHSAPSAVPYVRQNQQYNKVNSEHAVTGEQVPPAYKDMVKKYFSSFNVSH
jgi:hypothetical protein